ncbi:MAG: hypothetical protein IKW96_14640 [Ruminococcus sp.]|uniref:hypothetical protein n=1 Tax=Ruminococcus sp. TaxID=41978 RepID=UPI0025FEC589|nr:hypothetical protein [Ruminococcus sp.]MBR5684489.1 hypothetical protein [Ruminococcus sp.]
MNISKKKAIALASVLCVAFSSLVSCLDNKEGGSSDKNDTNSKSSSSQTTTAADGQQSAPTKDISQIKNDEGAVVGTPFQSGSAADFAETGMPVKDDLNADDPTSKEPATEVVEVTEANGEKATDAQGQVVTEIVTKAPSADDYVSKTDKRYCLWIDISADPDTEKEYKGVPITQDGYAFNDQIVKVTFKLKDNIPDRDYAVRFNPDFSSLRGVSLKPKVVQGNIRVGGDIAAQDVSGESDFVAYGDNISAKPGDTVDYYINLKNNPGLAAMLLWVYYDSNAMDVQSITAAGDYAKIARGTETGSK